MKPSDQNDNLVEIHNLRFAYGRRVILSAINMVFPAVGLRNAAQLKPGEISGGMARRVALARTIALDPALIMSEQANPVPPL